MNSSQNSSEQETQEKFSILIKRKDKQAKNAFSISYDTSPIDKLTIEEEEKSNLLKLIKNVLLSCNFSYINYINKKISSYLTTLFLFNLFYFIIINYLINFLNKQKAQKKEQEVSFWKKLILFNLPELLILFFYRIKKYSKINKSINALFSYLNERIIYIFNTDTKNNYLCKINPSNYDLLFFKKNDEIGKNNLYKNNEEYLSKDTFFKSVIAYPNANFEDFDFNNLEKNEEKMFQDIFILINKIEKKIKEDHKFLNTIGTLGRNLSYSNSTKFNILYALGFKIGGFLVDEIYLNNFAYKIQRKQLIEEKSKEFNQKNISNGYFLAINENVILLFRIKDSYKSFDESYAILYNDSQNLLKHYFA